MTKAVVQGVGVEDLKKGPGHYPQTPMPGQKGNAAIAGHRTTYGHPFYDIDALKAGDDIFISTREGKFQYKVDHSMNVNPSDVAVLDPTTDNRLTLTTCTPKFPCKSPESMFAFAFQVRMSSLMSQDLSKWFESIV